jgi:hypothetical protein
LELVRGTLEVRDPGLARAAARRKTKYAGDGSDPGS